MKLEKVTLRCAAPDLHQPGPLESVTRHHHSQADVQASRHTIRFRDDGRRDPIVLTPDSHEVTDLDIQPDQNVFPCHSRIGLQGLIERHRRIQSDRPVIGIVRGIHGFNRNQNGRGGLGGRCCGHRDCFSNLRPLHSPRREGVELLSLVTIRQYELACREVCGHHSSCLARQHRLEALAETANAGQRAYTSGYAQHNEHKLHHGRSCFAPGDARGRAKR